MIVNKSGVGSATPSVLIVALAFFLPSKWDMTKSSPALLNWKTGANDGKINIKLYLPGIIMKFICFVLMLPLAFVLFKIINETKLLGLILTSDSGWYHNHTVLRALQIFSCERSSSIIYNVWCH